MLIWTLSSLTAKNLYITAKIFSVKEKKILNFFSVMEKMYELPRLCG
jgi:hypothetical protein